MSINQLEYTPLDFLGYLHNISPYKSLYPRDLSRREGRRLSPKAGHTRCDPLHANGVVASTTRPHHANFQPSHLGGSFTKAPGKPHYPSLQFP
ncbi:hypothetical protein AVEN_12126-1 [Araneus ventricosus]|uniref:Uncharacterized protein n=1 Tax=Araneus ventricosus TaxID=182803 RepID=A0A4Y2FWS9_ARAVE|nr:hypothetical protein AVEN_12126-1 [Araneus ventricosus]